MDNMDNDAIIDMIRRRDQAGLTAHFHELYKASVYDTPEGFMVHDAPKSTFYHFCGNPMREANIRLTNSFNCGAMPISGWNSHTTIKPGDFFRKLNERQQVVLHFVLSAGPAVRSYEDSQNGYSISLNPDEVHGYQGGVGINGQDRPEMRPPISFI